MDVSDVWMTPTPLKESRIWRICSCIVILLVSVCGRIIFGLNKTSVHRKEIFLRCVTKRPQIKPLITVSNHNCVIDDILLACRVIPIVRGTGVYQRGMDFCSSRLNSGESVHIYPEGRVNKTKDFIRIKWGVGRLITESKVTPVVLPYWHVGMENVYPGKKPYYPRVGKKVTVVMGDPIDFEDGLKQLQKQKKPEVV